MRAPKEIAEAYKKHKYKAKSATIDGIRFQSTKEGARYQDLKLMEKAGHITNLELQPKFRLQDGFSYMGTRIRPIVYIADFRYKNSDGMMVVEDVKGFKTPEYKIKRKLFLKKFGDQFLFREI